MKVNVQFFSRLRDIVAAACIEVDLPVAATLADLLDHLYARYPALKTWDAHLLLAIGLDYAERGQELRPGDVISIMPPVQGG